MNIVVDKDNVKLSQADLLHKGEYNINTLNFTFSEEYNGLSKMAVFSTMQGSYETAILNNTCIIPEEVLKSKGIFTIGVYAYIIEADTVVKRYSPKPITIAINNGSYIQGASNPQTSAPTQFEAFVQEVEEALEEKQDKLTEGNNINIDGNVISTPAEENTIETISVNGTEQLIKNKNVNIAVPTKTSDITNDSDYISSKTVTAFWNGTQAQYDEIEPKVETTLYLIDEEE